MADCNDAGVVASYTKGKRRAPQLGMVSRNVGRGLRSVQTLMRKVCLMI